MQSPEKSHDERLSKSSFFEKQGYVGPFNLGRRDSVFAVYNASSPVPKVSRPRKQRYLLLKKALVESIKSARRPGSERPTVAHDQIRTKPVYDLATESQILDDVSDLLGDDILLWKSTAIRREPGTQGQAWHVDLINERVRGVHVSVAVTDMTLRNGCLQLIPGTHRYQVDLRAIAEAGECDLSDALSMVALADRLHPENAPHKVLAMEMLAGQYFFTRGGLWHGVGSNFDDHSRIALVARFARTDVEVKNFREEYVPSILVRGEDSHRLNFLKDAPTA